MQATDVIWKVLVCLTLFSLANFLKSVLTKLLSSHFYKYVPGPGPSWFVCSFKLLGWVELVCGLFSISAAVQVGVGMGL